MNLLNALVESAVSSTSSSSSVPPGGGILDGNAKYDFASAGLTALVAIVIVFAVLIVIILITHFLFLGINKTDEAIQKSNCKWLRRFKKNTAKASASKPQAAQKVEITDDDMMAAVLTATIDYQNEVKTDVKLVSVKEIK